jgi:hypothetical protein
MPASMALTMADAQEGGQAAHRWLLTESWWADGFVLPNIAQLLTLSVRLVGKSLRKLSAFLARECGAATSARPYALGLANSHLKGAHAAVAGPEATADPSGGHGRAVVGGRGIVSRIGNSILSIQGVLIALVGDCLVWRYDPTRWAALLGKVDADLTWLSARCGRVAVVAHSQGASIAGEVLAVHGTPENLALLVTYGTSIRPDWRHTDGQVHASGVPETDAACCPAGEAGGLDGARAGQGASFLWLDFAAESDPFAGPSLPSTTKRLSFRVRNEGSLFTDHWAYWRNTEEFVAPLMLALIHAEAKPLQFRRQGDQELLAHALALRRRRGAILVLSRAGALALAIAPLLCLSTKAAGQFVNREWQVIAAMSPGCGWSCRSAPTWLARGAGAMTAWSLTLATSALVAMTLTRIAWRRWDRQERARVLDRQLTGKISWVATATLAYTLLAPTVLLGVALVGHAYERFAHVEIADLRTVAEAALAANLLIGIRLIARRQRTITMPGTSSARSSSS